ncbi:hypothetical protein LJC32_02650 [Oscillospiraceae bacterium OttesenSCG-928-F05]|nr:hypothetical protein [Oscillospiraceae bacterium OttesenSCG-928-F05]
MQSLTLPILNLLAQTFVSAIDHIAYLADGVPKQLTHYTATVDGSKVHITFTLDGTVSGQISGISLVDADEEPIYRSDRVYIKPASKSLYVAFDFHVREANHA